MLDHIKTIYNNRRFKQLIRIVLGVIAVWIIVNKVDIKQAIGYISKAKGVYLLLAFISFFLSRFFAAFRINILYRSQNLLLPTILNIQLYFLSMFYNLFIPLLGGEGFKAIWLKKRYETNYKMLVSSAFLDRLSGVSILSVLCIAFAIWSSLQLAWVQSWLFALAPLVLIGHFLFMKMVFPSYSKAWLGISTSSLVIQILQLVTTYFILLALGVNEHILDYLFIFLLSSFAFVLPMIGAREMAFVFGAEYLGLNMELSLAVSLIFYLCTAFNSLLGSYYLLFPSKLKSENQ